MGEKELSRRGVLQLGLIGVSAAVLPASSENAVAAEGSYEVLRAGKERLAEFVALSEALTGVQPLDRHLALRYMERFERNPVVGPLLSALLDAYQSITLLKPADQPAALKTQIFDSTALRPAAEQVVYLWYTSAFALRDQANPNNVVWEYGDEYQYNNALIWNVIHGHPPMTTPSEWTAAPKKNVLQR